MCVSASLWLKKFSELLENEGIHEVFLNVTQVASFALKRSSYIPHAYKYSFAHTFSFIRYSISYYILQLIEIGRGRKLLWLKFT